MARAVIVFIQSVATNPLVMFHKNVSSVGDSEEKMLHLEFWRGFGLGLGLLAMSIITVFLMVIANAKSAAHLLK